jgi:uncharacterized membrane protein
MGDRRQGLALAGVSLAALVLVLKILIPYMSGLGHYGYTNTYAEVLQKPWLIPALIATPEKMRTVGLWLAPFLLLPLRSPLVLLIVPLALERFLSGTASHWGTSFHYSAPLAPILAMSAGDGLSRLLPLVSSERRARLVLGVSIAVVILSAILPGRQPAWRLFAFDRYVPGEVERSAPEAFSAIPPDASVAAPAAIAAHLSMRHHIVLIEPGSRPTTEFIVVHQTVNPWPLEHFDALQAVLDDRRANGYEATYEKDGWTILRRTH